VRPEPLTQNGNLRVTHTGLQVLISLRAGISVLVVHRGRRARSPHIFNFYRFQAPGVRLPEGSCFVGVKSTAPGLRIEKPDAICLIVPAGCRVTSGWASAAGCFTLTFLLPSDPIPVRPNFCAWECKLTPAGCACQEGNTIGCIPSNDGLGAGFRGWISTIATFQGFKAARWQSWPSVALTSACHASLWLGSWRSHRNPTSLE